MHRIRTWARSKARGTPLTTVNSHTRHANASGPSRTSRDGAAAAPAPNDGAADSKPGTAPATANGEATAAAQGVTDEKPPREKKNVAVRFFVTIKNILLSSWINLMLVFVPVAIAVEATHQSAGIIFAMNAIAIIPLAGLLSHATESVARRMGDTVGALMNVTFGNAVELIIFIIALVKDEIRIVQASLLGSILANLLLILGMCFLFGGLRFREQIYNSTVTQMSACLLSLSVTSLLLPTAFHASFSSNDDADDKVLPVSRGTSVILLLVYGLYLLFQLNSHAYMYESTPQHIIEREMVPGPAAHYFDSSSSSDTSSSSSSDSDDSGKSRSTAKKIKRAVKRRMSYKHSSSSSSDEEKEVAKKAIADAALVPGESPANGSSKPEILVPANGVQEALDTNAIADDEADEKPKAKTHRKKHKHHKKKKSSSAENVVAQPAGSPTHPADESEPRRVDFALAPDIEAQTDTRPKPFSLRSIRPQIPKTISQNVFTKNPYSATDGAGAEAAGPAAPTRPNYDLRRANSLPVDHRSYRAQPGAIPPIVPVIVNGTPKTQAADDDEEDEKEISRTTAVLLLLVSTGLVAVCAEFMVDSINEVVGDGNNGLSEAFIGLILLPIVGNAAEHVTAVTVAMKNKMDLAIGVALGSSIQIAIFVTPLVVILGWCMGKEMTLYFTLFETVSMFVSAFIVNFLVLDGRSNYLEGALLCCSYVIIAVAAFYYPASGDANQLGGGTGNHTTGGNSTQTEVVVNAARMLARNAGVTLW
ncbi:uncharacterized protein E0L32_004061 [Thyridium curvatum]|uniref:Sodium/calcium exchanger membrane region domain-containing protein n=1 Tax=Thyridium curvatum TaxID=1093900 RepID=A0A507BA37_9PEZI|nr:uncharacterized protein E0L32_004061 [Thyridium curvatum]TPX16066.1 hypothetical protein E0L32_004061 [Thyridium curvatum]